jgi:hypothetical protein
MLKRLLLTFVVLGFISPVFADGPFDGKWTADVVRPAPAGPQTLAFNFAVTEGKVTGTFAIQGTDTVPIDWGMTKGDVIAFKVKMAFNNAPTTFVYLGKIDGDQISFGRRPEDLTLGRLVEFTAKRVK